MIQQMIFDNGLDQININIFNFKIKIPLVISINKLLILICLSNRNNKLRPTNASDAQKKLQLRALLLKLATRSP